MSSNISQPSAVATVVATAIDQIEQAIDEGRRVEIMPDGEVIIGPPSFATNLEECWKIHLRIEDWEVASTEDILFLGMGAAGELGEYLNQVKKFLMNREPHARGLTRSEIKEKAEEELGNTLVYLYLQAKCLGLDFSKAVEKVMPKIRSRFPVGSDSHGQQET